VQHDARELAARSRKSVLAELAMDAAETSFVALEEDTAGVSAEAQYGGCALGWLAVRPEASLAAEVELQPLEDRPFDRNVPPCRAAGAAVPAGVSSVRPETKGRPGV
jgi:hypothetical protein